MKKTAPKQKQISGFPLEVRFTDDGYRLVWDTRLRMSAFEYRFFCEYAKDKAMALLYFGAMSAQKFTNSSPSVRFLHNLAVDFLRSAARCDTPEQLREIVASRTAELIPQVTASGKISETSIVRIYEILTDAVCRTDKKVKVYVGSIYKKAVAAYSITFSIEESPENKQNPYRLLVTCKYDNKELPLREALAVMSADDDTRSLLTGSLRLLSQKSEFIKKIHNDGMVLDSYVFSDEEMYVFLRETELYAAYGITCRVPTGWKKHKSSISLGLYRRAPSLGTESILSFDINIAIDGETLTDEEIAELLAAEEHLFMFRGRWVELKKSEMKSALLAYESLKSAGGISLADAMRAFLSPESISGYDDEYELPVISFAEGCMDLSGFDPGDLPDVNAPSEYFTATLRPYQADGVRWLNLMRRMGLGAALSDDMGLGKTIQAIAVLEQIRQTAENARMLIVVPASLLRNWQDEITRFAPFLKFRILHSNFGDMYINPSEDTNVFITTYAMMTRLPQLRSIVWDCMILDEAQAIKNPNTMQSRASKTIPAKFRVAMTGTPIENSITDLWSIFDFLNPQLFHNALEKLTAMAQTGNATERLKSLVRPFILRRLKTDKSIITDLPEKIEMKSYCTLTQHQAVLYKQITSMLSEEIRSVSGMERRGMVLAGILRLKQICNHPDQFNGSGAFLQMESGKFIRLAEICEDIKQRHERVLVFTQFKEMCEPLSAALREIFGQDGLIIHGSTSIKERGEIVERFNDPDEYVPYIVLSLRAGGVGLNLTAANHVIHFDRWWNPAVENQATDRAFRIGQTGNVLVHKLICTGTLEEKIDKLIESKSALAADIVENDVKLTELSNDELLALLRME